MAINELPDGIERNVITLPRRLPEALLMATPTDSPIGRNLAVTRGVRLGLGHTRDVSMIEGEVTVAA